MTVRSFAILAFASALALLGVASCAEDQPRLRADFTWDFDPSQTQGTACSFTTTLFLDSSEGDPQTWHWEFPDGRTSDDQNPRMERMDPGKVTLTVGRGGEFDSVSHDYVATHC